MRADIDAPHGLHLYHYAPKDKNPAEDRIVYYVHGGGFMRGNEQWCRRLYARDARFARIGNGLRAHTGILRNRNAGPVRMNRRFPG